MDQGDRGLAVELGAAKVDIQSNWSRHRDALIRFQGAFDRLGREELRAAVQILTERFDFHLGGLQSAFADIDSLILEHDSSMRNSGDLPEAIEDPDHADEADALLKFVSQNRESTRRFRAEVKKSIDSVREHSAGLEDRKLRELIDQYLKRLYGEQRELLGAERTLQTLAQYLQTDRRASVEVAPEDN